MKTPRIDSLLERVSRSLMWAEVAELSLNALPVVAGVWLVGVFFDAAIGFHRIGLVVLVGVLLTLTAVAVIPALVRLRRGRAGPRESALVTEDRLGIADNRLVNALDLAGRDTTGTSAALRDEVITRGETIAGSVDPAGVIDRVALHRAVKPAGAAAIVWIVVCLLMPGVFHAVVPRLFAPFADYPPFTSIRFDVRNDPVPVFVGSPATIRVELTGPRLPDRAQIVFVDEDIRTTPLPMDRVSVPADGGSVRQAPQRRAARFLFRVDRVIESREFYIQTPRGRSGLYTLAVDTSPLINEVRVALDFPAYTGWPDSAGALSPLGISALTDTDITLHLASNVALGGGELRLMTNSSDDMTPRQVIPLIPDPIDPRMAQTTFKLEYPGRFELSLIGADGSPGVKTLKSDLRVVPDRVPKIDIVKPMRGVVAPEGWTVPVQFTAGDDIEVARVTLHQGLNENPTASTELTDTVGGGSGNTAIYADHRIDLETMGARSGDVVRYHAQVEDNRPGGSQTVKTPVHSIHVVTMSQYLELARMRYGAGDLLRESETYKDRLIKLDEQRDRLIDRIKSLRVQMGSDEALPGGQRDDVTALGKALDHYADQSDQLSREIIERTEQATLYEIETPYKQVLGRVSSGLRLQANRGGALSDALGALHRGSTPARRQDVIMRAKAFEDTRAPFNAELLAGLDIPLSESFREDGAELPGGLAQLPMGGPAVPGPPTAEGPGGVAVSRQSRAWYEAIEPQKDDTRRATELIQADAVDPAGRGAYTPPGVPIEYREQAEAYFKRLAEDSR